MSWTVLWDRNTKELLSILVEGSEPASDVLTTLKCGMTIYENEPVGTWNKNRMDFDPWPTPVLYKTKLEFRNLFSQSEKIFYDNFDSSEAATQYKQMLRSLKADLDAADAVINIKSPEIAMGLDFLTLIGMLAVGRKEQIMNGETPPV
jgi:hypothetical protein